MSSDNDGFSGYGMYNLSDNLNLQLPKIEIQITRKSDGRLSYYRKNSTNQEIKKSLSSSDKNKKIELCPVLPLHLPAKKTNDLIFLRLDESLFVEKKSTTNVLVQFPIEIGVFVINSSDNSKELFDCFTCEPMHSRFALYGTPEQGNLCMYSKVKLLENNESSPYIFAKMRVIISNELNHGVSVGKLVFPITSHTIYYRNNSHEVHIDDIRGVLKHDLGNDVIEINRENYSPKEENLNIVSYSEKKEKSSFVMDKGFD